MADEARDPVNIDDIDLAIDIKSLTIGELEDVEEITGMSLQTLRGIDFADPPLKMLRALAFIVGRRTDPAFTQEDARNVKITAFGNATPQAPEAAAPVDPTSSPAANGDG